MDDDLRSGGDIGRGWREVGGSGGRRRGFLREVGGGGSLGEGVGWRGRWQGLHKSWHRGAEGGGGENAVFLLLLQLNALKRKWKLFR